VTERLYYRDAALLAFDANVIAHVGDARHVVLDRTAFYPTSGGQPHDVGRLNDAGVIDVIDNDAQIVHVTDIEVPLGPVHGEIDAGRRHDHMQQHTAQHLLSALAADRLKWETTSVHFGAGHSTIEFATGSVSARQLVDLQSWANTIVAEARVVTVTFEDAASAEAAGLRKPTGRTGEIRVITIDGVDRSACGGTHLSRSSEIGAILLLDTEKIRNNVRLGFLAGNRVLAHAAAHDALLARLARDAGCAVNQLEAFVPARQQEIKLLREHASALEREVATARLQALYRSSDPHSDGLRRLELRATDQPATLLRAMAQEVAALERATFAAIAADPPTIYFATSADSGIDAGAALKPALTAVGGRGGGSARIAQGTAASVEQLEQVGVAVSATH
jgi:alanyl-tRNA synthetase